MKSWEREYTRDTWWRHRGVLTLGDLSGVEVEYSRDVWELLREKRNRAIKIMRILSHLSREVIVHGSLARGDVKPTSDIDIVVIQPVSPGLLELSLERAGYTVYHKEIVQATPNYTPKIYFYLDPEEEIVVSTPLSDLKEREREFYKWGGELDLPGLLEGKRVPGVSKDLKLIIPTERGHKEIEVVGNESIVARVIGVSIETVLERVRVLERRKEHGRTGVFLKVTIPAGESVESVIDELSHKNPYFRRALER